MREDDRLSFARPQAAQRDDDREAGEVRPVPGPTGLFSPGDMPGRTARAPAAPALDYYLPLQVTQEVIAVGLACCRSRQRGQCVGHRSFCCARVTGQQRSQLNQGPIVSLVWHVGRAALSRLPAAPCEPTRSSGIAQRNSRIRGLPTCS